MQLLYSYQNGNVKITIFDSGTKIQEWDDNEIPSPVFPCSMDVKITNYCNLNCNFCHEQSTTKGKHCNIDNLLNYLSPLPAGTELAIGGGNPLDHPQLIEFLEKCKLRGHICNMTINFKHLIPSYFLINELIENKLIWGLGISISDDSNLDHLKLLKNTKNAVFHIISGVNNISILEKIKNSSIQKTLILGYKEFGRGINFYNEAVENCKTEWFDNLHKYIKKVHLSFDNLAIKQLNVKRFLTTDEWNNLYMGNDGQFTMYVDAVKEQYSISSTGIEKFKITNIVEDFKKINEHEKFISKNKV